MTWPWGEPFCPRGSKNLEHFLLIHRSGRADVISSGPGVGLSQVRGRFLSPHQAWSGASRTIGPLTLRILEFAAFTASCPMDDCWGRAISGAT